MDLEKLRAQPEIVAPEYFQKLKQEFGYIPLTDQVKIQFKKTGISLIKCTNLILQNYV